MPRKELLTRRPPAVRAELGGVVAAVIAARREAMDYHDAVLAEQAASPATEAGAMEQTQQTMGAMVRELNTLLEQARKVQVVGDQLDRVLDDLRGQGT